MNNQYALITGASQGLGKAYAEELAKRKKNLILVSLPGQNLKNLSDRISKENNVVSYYYETDFSSDQNILDFSKWVNEHFDVNLLINNAGIGGTQSFEEVNYKYIDRIIQVNVKATALLTHQLLKNLKGQKQSYILNISSIAAYTPVGFKTVYPASKAFIQSFSRGLNAELKNTNISVSVMNPGAMATNDEISSRIEKQGFIGKLSILKPDRVARYSINRLLKKDEVIVVNPFLWFFSIILPVWIKLPLMTKIIKRELKYKTGTPILET